MELICSCLAVHHGWTKGTIAITDHRYTIAQSLYVKGTMGGIMYDRNQPFRPLDVPLSSMIILPYYMDDTCWGRLLSPWGSPYTRYIMGRPLDRYGSRENCPYRTVEFEILPEKLSSAYGWEIIHGYTERLPKTSCGNTSLQKTFFCMAAGPCVIEHQNKY